jgi:hypothetical protein
LAKEESVAKRKNAKRARKDRTDDVERTTATTFTARDLRLRRQRWRALKKTIRSNAPG